MIPKLVVRRWSLPLLAGLIFIVLLFPFHWVIREGSSCERCEMSMMNPNYVELSVQVQSPYAYKYRLFHYFDELHARDTSGSKCLPVIFVPGSAGHYRQVRSLASTVLAMPNAQTCHRFYAVDFLEEFVAFSARLLRHQARYLNDVIRYLISIFPHTDSTILVGHSFGGVVLRMLPTLDNYLLKNHRNFVITIASPHVRPPLDVSLDLDMLYEDLAPRMVNVSIASGSADIQVPAQLSVVRDFNSQTVNLRVEKVSYASANPNHVAMVWEKTLLLRIATLIHKISNKEAKLHSEYRISEILQKEYLTRRDYFVSSGTSLVCDRFIKEENGGSSHTRGWTRADVCSRKDDESKHQVCILLKHQGPFQISTAEEYGAVVEVYATKSYAAQRDGRTIVLENSTKLHIERFPGATRPLATITGAVTHFTEYMTRIVGSNSPGIVILRYDCGANMLFGHSLGDWINGIAEWESVYSNSRATLPTSFTHNTSLQDYQVNALDLLLGTAIPIKSSTIEVRLAIKAPLNRALSLTFTTPSSGHQRRLLGVAAYDANHLGRFSTIYPDGRHELVAESDTRHLHLYLEGSSPGETGDTIVWVKPNYRHSFVLTLTEEPSRLFIELYSVAVLRSARYELPAILIILLGRTILFEARQGAVATLLALIRSLWIAILTCLLSYVMVRRMTISSGGQWKWVLTQVLIFLMPISTDLQVLIQLPLLVIVYGGFNDGLMCLLWALAPKLLKVAFDIRNLAISMGEIGWWNTIRHETSLKFFWSVASFIPVFELIIDMSLSNKLPKSMSAVTKGTLAAPAKNDLPSPLMMTARIWAIVLAVLCYTLYKPYYLPLIHFTLQLARVL